MVTYRDYTRKHGRFHGSFNIRMLAYNHNKLDSEYCTCAEGISISPGGISFKYPRVIGDNDHLRILISEVRGMRSEEIMANIRVTWSETKDILSKRYGAKFVKLHPDKKYKLLRLIRQNGGN